ncbi:hypothetical protein FJR48_00760 [Sulfurimonas lithotrophica]|uniref:Uncharacterized protein n=1 Tax=Sulfurimonas lithotrophica TaxID=2590022 RepID=A0A5P8NY29_9BACT|nr:hypothetical protein [Sulfurimonas lithotrophica]QFR48331.1 hypothetical protein FJR48_00760 [Sulfurimonas lithotrophica]
MYYVIKRQHSVPLQHFIGFAVNKFITSINSENVIFEFEKNGKTERKWVKREDVVLLTKDKKYFLEIFNQFKETEAKQQKLVDEAQEKLNQSIENFESVMNEEMNKFEEIKGESDIPCIMKNY